MEDVAKYVIPKIGLKLVDLQDKTKDYHWSSVADPDHFGHWTIKWSEHTLNKITYFLKGLVTDHHFVHHWLYYFCDTWMHQFGGYQETPLTDKQVENALVHLKYFMLEQ